MKSVGIIRKVDELGRIVIPIEIRNNLKISEKDSMEIYVEGRNIIIKKHEETCIICGNSKELVDLEENLICLNCIKKIQSVILK